MRIVIRFIQSNSLVSKVIRYWTRGDWSHVELMMDDGWLVSSITDGVEIKPFGYNTSLVMQYTNLFTTTENYCKIMDFAAAQVGKPYDWKSILGFIFRRDWTLDNSWICSELILASLMAGDVTVLNTNKLNRVDPNTLYLSPVFIPERG